MDSITNQLKANVAGAQERHDNNYGISPVAQVKKDRSTLFTTLETAFEVIEALEASTLGLDELIEVIEEANINTAEHGDRWCVICDRTWPVEHEA